MRKNKFINVLDFITTIILIVSGLVFGLEGFGYSMNIGRNILWDENNILSYYLPLLRSPLWIIYSIFGLSSIYWILRIFTKLNRKR